MFYEFKCEQHGKFTIRQPMMTEHKANCPECGKQAQRIFLMPQWFWTGSVFRPDGSLRQQDDYASEGVIK